MSSFDQILNFVTQHPGERLPENLRSAMDEIELRAVNTGVELSPFMESLLRLEKDYDRVGKAPVSAA